MSLNIWLVDPKTTMTRPANRIFVRENGQTVELSNEEWNLRFPDRPILPNSIYKKTLEETAEVWSGNITYNLGRMARQLTWGKRPSLYDVLWNPVEHHCLVARDIIPFLKEALYRLKFDPEYYKRFNPPNGWGTYEVLVDFVQSYLMACRQFPDATICTGC